MPLLAQAYGNLFVPALLLVFGLGAMLYAAGRRSSASIDVASTSFTLNECHGFPNSTAVFSRS